MQATTKTYHTKIFIRDWFSSESIIASSDLASPAKKNKKFKFMKWVGEKNSEMSS